MDTRTNRPPRADALGGSCPGDASGFQDFNYIRPAHGGPALAPRYARGRGRPFYFRARRPHFRASPRGFYPREGQPHGCFMSSAPF